jgi:hypothetical protein
MTLRLALVGCGSMGLNHARVIATGSRTDLVTIIDPDETVGRTVAERYGATWAPDLDGLTDVDAAVIAAPTEHHHRLALPVIEAGLPLLIEKPVCPSVADTEEIVAASERAGTPLMCGLLERFNPAVMVAFAMAEQPLHVRTERHSPYVPRIKTGVAWDLLVHDVDLVVRFGDGIATASASRMGQRKVRTMVIWELDKMIEVDLLRRGVTVYRHTHVEASEADRAGFRQSTEIEIPEILGSEPLVSQLDHFVNLLEGTVDVEVERASILPAHRVVESVLAARDR